jgi:ribosomal protein S18 acetylase RimI-like enzyme
VCVGSRVVGYYAIAAGAVMRSSFPRKLRHGLPDPVPVLVLGRLAVDGEFERRGIGSHLLKEAMQRILALSEAVGLRAIFVHAVDDEAVAFYVRYGFVQFPAGERTLFLPVETIAASLEI